MHGLSSLSKNNYCPSVLRFSVGSLPSKSSRFRCDQYGFPFPRLPCIFSFWFFKNLTWSSIRVSYLTKKSDLDLNPGLAVRLWACYLPSLNFRITIYTRVYDHLDHIRYTYKYKTKYLGRVSSIYRLHQCP